MWPIRTMGNWRFAYQNTTSDYRIRPKSLDSMRPKQIGHISSFSDKFTSYLRRIRLRVTYLCVRPYMLTRFCRALARVVCTLRSACSYMTLMRLCLGQVHDLRL